MSLNSASLYENDPLFSSAMHHFHLGQWKDGLSQLGQVLENYPDAQELQDLNKEMQMRARIDDVEGVERTQRKRKRIFSTLAGILLLALLAGLAWFSGQFYFGWVRVQMTAARQALEDQTRQANLSVMLSDAQELLQNGRVDKAQEKINAITAVDPNFSGLKAVFQKAEQYKAFDQNYEDALRFHEQGKYLSAIQLLEEIQAKEPNFKDVSTRLVEINRQAQLADSFNTAEEAYRDRNWKKAAAAYEAVRVSDPAFNAQQVEERLYNAYLNAAFGILDSEQITIDALKASQEYFNKAFALRPQDRNLQKERDKAFDRFESKLAMLYFNKAQEVLSEQPDNLDVLTTAETYFRQALAVQPANQDILLQWQLAKTYLDAQHNFDRGSWDEAVEALEFIHQEAPDYALGTARQTLYEAYLARGQRSMLVAKYDLALSDFQQAAVIAEEGSEPALRIMNAQVKIATTLGALGNLEEAVVIFKNIFEGLDLDEATLKEYPALSSALTQAARYDLNKNYKAAYKRYSEAVPQALVLYANEVDYTVQPGDYLPQIARTYNTTIDAIVQANKLTDSYQVNPGSKLIIPKGKP